MLEPRVYAELRQDIIDVLESDTFENEKIKVIVKQMGIGKSYLQGNELPNLLQKNFPKLKFIITSGLRNKSIDLEAAKKRLIYSCTWKKKKNAKI